MNYRTVYTSNQDPTLERDSAKKRILKLVKSSFKIIRPGQLDILLTPEVSDTSIVVILGTCTK